MKGFRRERRVVETSRTIETTLMEVLERLSESMPERRATATVVDLIRSGRVRTPGGLPLELDPRHEDA